MASELVRWVRGRAGCFTAASRYLGNRNRPSFLLLVIVLHLHLHLRLLPACSPQR
jgi:hypothetical protein